jgi:hypothetical protein
MATSNRKRRYKGKEKKQKHRMGMETEIEKWERPRSMKGIGAEKNRKGHRQGKPLKKDPAGEEKVREQWERGILENMRKWERIKKELDRETCE